MLIMHIMPIMRGIMPIIMLINVHSIMHIIIGIDNSENHQNNITLYNMMKIIENHRKSKNHREKTMKQIIIYHKTKIRTIIENTENHGKL